MKQKHLALLGFFFITHVSTLYSQEYYPFPDSNAIWKIIYHSYPPGPMPSYDLHFDNYVDGDTIIDDSLYKKVYQIGYDPDCSLITYGPFYMGAYRNDETTKKVFFIPESHTDEELLYDFSLNIGDTVPQTYINWDYPELVVDSIDSIQIGDYYRKRFYYLEETCAPIEIIEGIGAHTGLLEPMEIFEHQHYLRCFHLENELLYIFNADSCSLETDTCLSVQISVQNESTFCVKVTPNPISENLRVEINTPFSPVTLYKLTILNANGITQRIFRFSTDNKVFSLNCLSSGLYIWVLESDNKQIATGKIVKL